MLDTKLGGNGGIAFGWNGATGLIALILFATTTPLLTTIGQESEAGSKNSALYYYQAMLREDALNATFPDSNTRFEVKRKLSGGVFDEDVERYLNVTDRYLLLFNKGADAGLCIWNAEFGGALHGAILSNMKSLAQDALGRYEHLLVKEHDEAGAVRQFVAVWNASNNFEEDKVIIGMLVRSAIQQMAASRLERTLVHLSQESLSELRAYFDREYENRRWELGERLRTEIDLFKQIVQSRPDASASEEQVKSWEFTVADSLPIGRNGVGYDTIGEAMAAEEECLGAAVELAGISVAKQFQTAVETYESKWKVSERFVPEWIESAQLRRLHAKAVLDQARLAQITCALRVAEDGPDALSTIPYPTTGRTFDMIETDTGFTLRTETEFPNEEAVTFTYSRPMN